MYQSGSTIWGGFDGSMRVNLKIPAFARAGDSFTLELPPELKLSHVANPNNVWTTVSQNGMFRFSRAENPVISRIFTVL